MAAQTDPIREWRERYARHVLNIDFEPLPNAPFHASFELILETPRLVRAAFSPGLNFRDKALVKDGDDHLWLMICRSRSIDVMHRRQELRLRRGAATMIRVDEAGALRSSDNFGFIGLMIPDAECDARSARLDDTVMQHVSWQSEALHLLRRYIRALEARKPPPSAEGHATIHRHVIDLAVLAATAHRPLGESSANTVVAARLSAALHHITSCFQDPKLSPATVAGSLGISPRYLQKLLERSGTSFIEYVNELRLQRAFTLLTGPSDDPPRISALALDCGFSDIAHFNRVFKKRFDASPMAIRSRR